MIDATLLKDFIIECIEEKKASDIIVIDLRDKSYITKYMIIASGRSIKNITAIADYVSLELKHKHGLSTGLEGIGGSEWVLVDAGDVILHMFCAEMREHLQLEKLWNK